MYKVLKKKIVSVLVLNQANVLTRVVSLFGRRGFNIDSLTVSATNESDAFEDYNCIQRYGKINAADNNTDGEA